MAAAVSRGFPLSAPTLRGLGRVGKLKPPVAPAAAITVSCSVQPQRSLAGACRSSFEASLLQGKLESSRAVGRGGMGKGEDVPLSMEGKEVGSHMYFRDFKEVPRAKYRK